MLINGKLVDGAKTLDVFNPATGGVLATCPRADETQLDEAVAAAKAAFPAWSAMVREEQFGPVLPVLSFEEIDDAIARANDTDNGLGGSVWAGNVERGVAVASKVQSGMSVRGSVPITLAGRVVWVNKWLDMPFDVPFRGAKQSGIGGENGQEGIEEYTQPRSINVAL
jgi:acyl-CoA reductase-like NAD-dependent aldehyde dehydrogenase